MPIDANGLVLGMQLGETVDNADPLRLGRIRVRIAGLIDDQSAWALPLNFAGHRYDVPNTKANYAAMTPPQDRPGDDVAVFFRDGDIDQPWYLPAHGGMPDGVTPEVPEPVKTMTPADAPKVKALEFGQWLIVADDRDATRGLRITEKKSNEVLFEYDGVNQGLRIHGLCDLVLSSDGKVTVTTPLCEVMGRRVMISKDDL